jgi:hypothetical protein
VARSGSGRKEALGTSRIGSGAKEPCWEWLGWIGPVVGADEGKGAFFHCTIQVRSESSVFLISHRESLLSDSWVLQVWWAGGRTGPATGAL